MAATIQLSVTGSADAAVIVQSFCKKIYVNETITVGGGPVNAFLVKKPLAGQTPAAATGIPKYAGGQYIFTSESGFFVPGQIAGYLKLSTAINSTTFDQDEDQGWSTGRTF